jgi:dihydrofolate reductase
MNVSLIVAMSPGRVVGRGGALPWHLPADLARFKRLTMGHHVIMGRRTFESLTRPLPGRKLIVVTRQTDYHASGAAVAHDLDEALRLAEGDDEPFVIGGAELYALALPRANRLYVTRVHADVEGDTHFPPFEGDEWALVDEKERPSDERNTSDMTFQVYERKR